MRWGTPIRSSSPRSKRRRARSGTFPISIEIPEGERAAQRLCEASFADYVFFCNSGAEAMECAIKVARKYQSASGAPERYRIITFEGSFHGRTLATLAAAGQKKYLDGFGPEVDGFDHMPFGDLEAVKRAIGPETAAILIEPLMGEGGVRIVEPSFLRALRALCDQHGLMLIFDEVQSGMGRTGELFAYQRTGVTPDIMALAKALGGGFPVGACLTTREAGKGMTPGTHGSTFGGNLLAMSAVNATLDVMLAPGFLRPRQAHGACLQAAACRDQRPLPGADRRGARRGILGRAARAHSGRRNGRRVTRREDDHGLRRRQRRAAIAAAHHQRAGNRRRHRPPRPRLRAAEPGLCQEAKAGSGRMSGIRHFLDLIDVPATDLRRIIDAARIMKAERRDADRLLAGKTLAMIFERPSTRTRVSFEVAMRQLGGDVILLTAEEMQLGRGETLADTARVLSRYIDAIMIRTLNADAIAELARYATVPVINGLTRRSHPCQVMADVMTFEEHRGPIRGRTVAWTGDANNVLTSLMQAAERFEFRLRVATPPGAGAEEAAPRMDKVVRRRDPRRHRPGRSRQGRRLRHHRHLGLHGRPQRRAAP